mmetsp:Transcript_5781/g.23735  ORF Transcript_5781/g.23735 Transcript_5781/m.23735 type:complete len:206 (+) Transcript_5781:272-889(+)
MASIGTQQPLLLSLDGGGGEGDRRAHRPVHRHAPDAVAEPNLSPRRELQTVRQRGDDERRREAVPRQTRLVLLERLVVALPSRRPFVRPQVRRHQRPPLCAAHPLPRARHLRNRRALRQPQEARGVEEILRGEHLAPYRRREVAPLHPAALVRARVVKPQQRPHAVHARGEVAPGPDFGPIGFEPARRDVPDGNARVRDVRQLCT